jgi:hypothetical protein
MPSRGAERGAAPVGKPKGAAMTGRTAAYGRAAFAWAVKRGVVHTNPFADLPVAKGTARRERVLSDDENRGDLARGGQRRDALRQGVARR